MTVGAFWVAVSLLRRQYNGWVTSGGRTDLHSDEVGGFANDPHTWDLGADMLYHTPPAFDDIKKSAETFGLRVIREKSKPHDHFQPLDFPAGPVTAYGGMNKTWV